ncbi:MAG: hypothetical protein KF871_15550 [Hydrogenophaga sp.]|uniref:hypothetical protein n=1 Tax=Hydrogenophaga sp. TaxID=1904254 RepID=UPI001DF63390|nr:hypothetical protein [Hydrogenophaga sp.]MBX3611307.1 hypothetical protein [Hydrogenophaga sp.]
MKRLWIPLALGLSLAACSSTPPPPDWQLSARSSLDNAAVAWLEGRDAVERAEFARARAAIARTARPDLLARAELHRCALRAATLQFEACSGFEALSPDAAPEDAAYARYLRNQTLPTDAALLPPAHRAALGAADPAAALRGIDDPITRLVAAGVAFGRAQASPGVVQLAVDTASAQGWPRPLLAWLGVQQQAARAAGDAAAVQRLQRRIDTVAPR